jgi:hypothetical protein
MTIKPGDRPWKLLDAYVLLALESHRPEIKIKLAKLMDAGQYRLMCHVDVDEDGQPDPNTLTYAVEILVSDGGWATLCTVHHSLLGLPDDEVIAEAESLMWQHGVGIPDDASSITDPPSDQPEA